MACIVSYSSIGISRRVTGNLKFRASLSEISSWLKVEHCNRVDGCISELLCIYITV